MLSLLSVHLICLLRHTLPLDFIQISFQIVLLQSHHMYWSLLGVGLMSEVIACIKSCPALYNSSTAFNMSHLATLRCGWRLYLKDVMAHLPQTFAKAKD